MEAVRTWTPAPGFRTVPKRRSSNVSLRAGGPLSCGSRIGSSRLSSLRGGLPAPCLCRMGADIRLRGVGPCDPPGDLESEPKNLDRGAGSVHAAKGQRRRCTGRGPSSGRTRGTRCRCALDAQRPGCESEGGRYFTRMIRVVPTLLSVLSRTRYTPEASSRP